MAEFREYLTRKEAAAYISAMGLRISNATLEKYAITGKGPPFFRQTNTPCGRVFYSQVAIGEWLRKIDPARA